MEVENVYPRKQFERAFQEKLDYGLMISLIATPILFAADDMLDINEIALPPQQANDECKRRLVGSIDEFIEWEFL